MRSEDFSKLVFEKVYRQDIERLRSIESMWKSRKPPTVLDFDSIATDAAGIDKSMAHQDQKEWSLAENFAVFYDRYSSSRSFIHCSKG